MCALWKNKHAMALMEKFVTEGTSFLLVNNIVFLYCTQCKGFFHLKCVNQKLETDDIVDIIETDYVCSTCQ